MANKKTTKRALLMSALSLLLCFSMLIGTTFAWFTDVVESGVNQIIAGNLDVEVYYGDPADKDSIQDVDTLFNDVNGNPILWEPGAVAWENLTVVNEGTLALKYQLSVNFDNENTVNGYGLSTALKVAVVENGFNGTREDAMELTYSDTLASFVESGMLLPADDSHIEEANKPAGAVKGSKTYGIVIYWEPGEDDNNWNVNNGKEVSDYAETKKNELHIDLGVSLVATQLTAEDDSFGPDYDENAWVDGMVVKNEADLKAALAAGGNVILADDIALTAAVEIPEGVTAALNLNGKTVSAASGNAIVNNGALTLTGGTVSAASAYAISNKGSLTVNGATVENGVNNSGYMEVNSGVINTTRGGGAHAVYHQGTMLTVNGGEFSGNGNEVIYVPNNSATTIINGGTFDKVEKSSYLIRGGMRATVNGGTFYAYDENGADPSTHYVNVGIINGGTFNYAVNVNHLGPQRVVVDNGDGTYIVLPGSNIELVSSGLYADDKGTYYVSSAAGLSHLNGIISQNVKSVVLMNDIDMTGYTWNMVDMHADFKGVLAELNGNGNTISNMAINGQAMFSRIATGEAVTFKDVTFDKVAVNSTSSNCAVIAKQVYADLTLDNVDVKNASISGETKVAVLVGTVYNEKSGTVTLTVKNCDITDCTVTGNPDDKSEERLAGMVAWVADKYSNEAIVLEGNTMTNVSIVSNSGAAEHHAVVYISDKSASNRYGVYHNEDTAGVTVENYSYIRYISDGLSVDGNGNYSVSNAAGLNTLNTMLADKTSGFKDVKSINLTADIDFADYTWKTVWFHQDQGYKFTTINGNGYTISNLKTSGQAMFSLLSMHQEVVIKDLTISGAETSGSYHVGVIIGQAATSVSFDNVHIVGANITGDCNVGGIIGSTGEFGSEITVTFNDCSVKDSNITAKGVNVDPTGASGFIGRALTLGTVASKLVFTGENAVSGNSITNENGLFGGAVYGYTTYDNDWKNTGYADDFTNWEGNE